LSDFPILEFDLDRTAIIEPQAVVDAADVPEHCVLCFFHDVIERAVEDQSPPVVFDKTWEDGRHQAFQLEYHGQPFVLMHPGIGGPAAAGTLEVIIALGCRKFIVCGGAGVLDKELAVGHLMVPTSAIRDEGTSYHYQPPGRTVEPDREAVAAIREVLKAHGVSYRECSTWTTDAMFRETRAKARRRLEEGCLTVEMEAAALFAVAKFRGVSLAQILYAGDAVVAEGWDDRKWSSRDDVRENLLWLAAEACLRL
jgi:uridine phosphorylase